MTSFFLRKTVLAAGFGAALAMSGGSGASAQKTGDADFQDRCARCHTADAVLAFTRDRADAADRQAWLDKVLSGHFAKDEAQRARIIEFLEERRQAPE